MFHCHVILFIRDYVETKYNENIFIIGECGRKTILTLHFKCLYFHRDINHVAICSVLYQSQCRLKASGRQNSNRCIVHTKRLVQVQTVKHLFLAINQMSMHCGYPCLLLLVTATNDFYKQKHKNTSESTWAFWGFSFISILTCWMDVITVYYFGNSLV